TYSEGDLNTNIGRPLANQRIFVLDDNQELVPVGSVGELYLEGAGLARGYLNRDELTAERFFHKRFDTDNLSEEIRLYKTGDLVRRLASGELEYIGRNDSQVKLRGYRIELGEIEQAISQIEGVKQAFVTTDDKVSGKKQVSFIVGYYTTNGSIEKLSSDTIHDLLTDVLPGYMVPSVLVEVASFPMTINGKLNVKALPTPVFSSSEHFMAPETDHEIEIAKLWETLLNHENIGVKDDFFRIGGTSLLAVQASHLMTKALNTDVRVGDIFKYRNIRTICTHFEEEVKNEEHVEWAI
ncbi:MAG: non-ribosomal peptide synthetase, partial [Cyclobacteriaceae bacterium]